VDWAALAGIDTLVFFMSVGKLPEIADKLISHGCPADTPAAIVQQAYWPGERTVVGTLSELPRLTEEAGIEPPATIVIGDVVKVKERMTTLHRDLRRDPEAPVGFGLSGDALVQRLTGALLGARDLEAALEARLFDHLREPVTASELAERLGCDPDPLRSILLRLASLGLLVRDERSFQCSEAAARFLDTTSPEHLGHRLDIALGGIREYISLPGISR
jgi:hypothetical protein